MLKMERPYYLKRDDDYYSDTLPLIIQYRTIRPEPKEKKKQLHWHEFFEIEFISRGSCEHILNNKSFTLSRGSACIVRPIDYHNVFAEGTSFGLYHIAFDIQLLSKEIADILTSTQSVATADFTPEEANYIENNLKFLIKQFEKTDPAAKFILRTGIEQLIMLILQKSNANIENKEENEYPPVIQQIISYLGLHFRNTIHLYDIADMFHLSSNYLGELFYKTIGMSFNDYINDIRLEYSKRLLLTTTLTVTQICFESGFRTNSHFIALFRKKYGKTPSQLRNENKD